MTSRRASRTSPPRTSGPRVLPALMRPGVRQLGRHVLNPGLPWEAQRRRLDRLTRASPVPRGTTVVDSVMNGVRTEVVAARGARSEPTVVHFHGGGYCVGSPRMARTWAAHLSAEAACRVVVPEYRLAPAHPYPAALHDARDVMNALLRESTATSIVVSSDSAGGGLALSLMLALRDESEELPAGCILMSPWLELGSDRLAVPELVRRDVLLSPRWLEACAIAYAHRADWADPSVSPMLAALGGLPALLIQAGSDELLAPDAEPWLEWPRSPGWPSPTPGGRACGTTSRCCPASSLPPTAQCPRQPGSWRR
jgi:epsilon-lactone hydrolase